MAAYVLAAGWSSQLTSPAGGSFSIQDDSQAMAQNIIDIP